MLLSFEQGNHVLLESPFNGHSQYAETPDH